MRFLTIFALDDEVLCRQLGVSLALREKATPDGAAACLWMAYIKLQLRANINDIGKIATSPVLQLNRSSKYFSSNTSKPPTLHISMG